jgi:hypothetical protein
MGALVLEVRLPGAAPYRAPCRQWFVFSKWLHISEGSVVFPSSRLPVQTKHQG